MSDDRKPVPDLTRTELYDEATPKMRARFVADLGQAAKNAFDTDFSNDAHEGQDAPDGDWRNWVIMAGRGFGKTRAGAEWVRSIADTNHNARIALIGASLGEARSVMVEGESGIMSVFPPENTPIYEASLRRVRFRNGAKAMLYSAAEPESLRGPQHSHAWCDEIAKWSNGHRRAERTWDNLQLGLRLGERQQVLATTTLRPVPLLQRLLASEGTVLTGGATDENDRNLPLAFIEAMNREYGDTALGRQELLGELLTEAEGALWSRALLERCREESSPLQGRGRSAEGAEGVGELGSTSPVSPHPLTPSPKGEWEHRRIVVAVDPPASTGGDACGIVVAGLLADGTGRVLADCSVERASPETWARAVANAAREWEADRVVAEANQGGAMVASVLRAAEVNLPLKLVHATRGKSARAEPVAALYEAGRVTHAGLFAKLEDQLCGLMAGGAYEGPGRSPDRADALVWALTELMLKGRTEPRVWGL